MATHLEWSEAIGKRVRSGDWADQAVSTVVKIEEELRAAGDDFGLTANRRENAAQLVDYFMEEAKVVYVVYKVWTAGFQTWLIDQGIAPDALAAEVDRLGRLMAYPDGTPLQREMGRPRAASRPAGERDPELRPARRRGDRGAGRRPRGLADAARPLRRPDGRHPRLRRGPVRRGRA